MKTKGYNNKKMFSGVSNCLNTKKIIPSKNNQSSNKVRDNINTVLDELNLHDGMTVSFHHHLRNGDYVLNMVMKEIANRGIKDITIFASSIFPCHEPLVKMIEDKVVTQIYAAYINGPVAKAISNGKMERVAVFHTHGGRVRLVESEDVEIDIAFIAAPTSDLQGNINGIEGENACGSLGYAYTDAQFAKKSVVITDNLVTDINYIDIEGKYIDFILQVDSIGDSKGIISGTTNITKNPIGLKIARLTAEVIKHSGYLKDGFSFQTGAGGNSLAVANNVHRMMEEKWIKGSFASGGITKYIVDMLEKGLFENLYDVQCFDLDAVESLRKNKNHISISASKYANINDDCIVNDLDVVILGASEIDLDYNVNVLTSSTGEIIGGSGGHSDTAYGSKLTIIVSQLFNARLPVIKDKVLVKSTPGETVDVLVTEQGIAINPRRVDLIDRLKNTNLPMVSIEDLKAYSDKMTGIPNEIKFTDEVVAVVEYRDGSVIDYVYKKK